MTEKEREKDIKNITSYRAVFGTLEGRAVLTDMLNDLGFTSTHVIPEKIVLQNYARTILWKCGIWREDNIFNITDKLFELPPVMPEVGGEK